VRCASVRSKFLEAALALAELQGGLGQRLLRRLHLVVHAALLAAGGFEPLLLFPRARRCGDSGLLHLGKLFGQLAMAHGAGLRVDFVAGAFRPHARHRALQLKQREFRLLQLAFLLVQLAVDDGQLAIALLENRVRGASRLSCICLSCAPLSTRALTS